MTDNNPVDRLGDAVFTLEELLLENDLAPDPERRNWAVFRRPLERAEQAAADVLSCLDQAWMFADESQRTAIASRSAMALHDAAVVLNLAERSEKARALLDRALALAQRGAARDAARAIKLAQERPLAATPPTYRRWLVATGRSPDGRPSRAPGPVRLEAAVESPVTGAPTLIRINGCGAGLYGHREAHEDGSYLAAYCISFLFIPIFPLCWYRVTRDDQLRYTFLGRQPLGAAGRIWQLAVVTSVAVGAAIAYRSG